MLGKAKNMMVLTQQGLCGLCVRQQGNIFDLFILRWIMSLQTKDRNQFEGHKSPKASSQRDALSFEKTSWKPICCSNNRTTQHVKDYKGK